MAKPENLDDNNSVILVDGSSYVYRAYHALPPLTTSTGQPTGAVRGVVTMVMRILQDHPNAPVGMVFDAKGQPEGTEEIPDAHCKLHIYNSLGN